MLQRWGWAAWGRISNIFWNSNNIKKSYITFSGYTTVVLVTCFLVKYIFKSILKWFVWPSALPETNNVTIACDVSKMCKVKVWICFLTWVGSDTHVFIFTHILLFFCPFMLTSAWVCWKSTVFPTLTAFWIREWLLLFRVSDLWTPLWETWPESSQMS